MIENAFENLKIFYEFENPFKEPEDFMDLENFEKLKKFHFQLINLAQYLDRLGKFSASHLEKIKACFKEEHLKLEDMGQNYKKNGERRRSVHVIVKCLH